MENTQISVEERLSNIETLLLAKKKTLTFIEACSYADIKPSFMYKLTSGRKIPHFKPNGKQIYFDIEELNSWLLSNPIKTRDELEKDALKHRRAK